jgi:hypothetical protein
VCDIFGDVARPSPRRVPKSRTGNALIAETAARDLAQLTLIDALDPCLLYRDQREKY